MDFPSSGGWKNGVIIAHAFWLWNIFNLATLDYTNPFCVPPFLQVLKNRADICNYSVVIASRRFFSLAAKQSQLA
jgi:hypothetical protein